MWPASGLTVAVPTADEWLTIAASCATLQGEQQEWRTGVASGAIAAYDGTLGSLFRLYQVDKDSPALEWRWRTRQVRTGYLAILDREIGARAVKALTFRDFKRWSEVFRAPVVPGGPERPYRAHDLLGMLKTVIAYGAAVLEEPDCARVHMLVASKKAGGYGVLRVEGGQRRTEVLTAAQVVAFRAEAHRQGWHSMALAQAIQFETSLRQKDIIGEWIPQNEPGLSDIVQGGEKWACGLHWRDISADMVLTKQISKSLRGRRNAARADAGKIERFDLKSYPMVMEELHGKLAGSGDVHRNRSGNPDLPTGGAASWRAGPLIICERTGLPWNRNYWIVKWREVARAAGIPDTVQNRDSRAGGITEGEEAGASLEHLRIHAAHSQVSQTAGYDRGGVATRNMVAQLRAKSRK